MKPRDDQLEQWRAAAEAKLWKKMDERGMTREGGWRVNEFTRDTRGGMEVVVRPVHLWHESPYDLEYVVWVSEGDIESSSAPQPLRRDAAPRH